MNHFSAESELPNRRVLWLPFVLIVLAITLRAVKGTDAGADWLPNFSPWMALAFTGTLLFPRVLPWWGVVAAMVGLDLIIQGTVLLAYPVTMVVVYGCLGLAGLAGARLRGRVGGLGAVGGALVCGLVFYAVTNTLSWLTMPEYAKSFAGWAQALTTGLPGLPPTWTFLRNSMISDAGFSLVLVLAHNLEAASRRGRPLRWGVAAA
jgi:hypothetical protein